MLPVKIVPEVADGTLNLTHSLIHSLGLDLSTEFPKVFLFDRFVMLHMAD